MLSVLCLTNNRKAIRDLRFASYGSWNVRWLSNPDALNGLLAIARYDVALLDVDMTGVYVPDVLGRIASISPFTRVFLLSRDYSPVFQRLSERYGCAGLIPLSRSGYPAHAAITRYLASVCQPAEPGGERSDNAPPVDPADACAVIEGDLASTLLGPSPQMRRIRHVIAVYRGRTEPVLITGESGTGKDLVARLIHRHSPVSAGPLVISNMSCIPEGIAESLLFGTKKGCYTGVTDNPGLFEQSNGGTLFLDEIGDLPPSLQPKLLRVLEEGTVRRLGSSTEREVRFRLICATNKTLEHEVSLGRFRDDLRYRLDVLRIEIPPLRERPDDIPALSASTLLRHGKTLSLSALDALRRHAWKGNVRELIHCVERSACVCEQPVIQADQVLF